MKAYYQDDYVTLYNGDCREIIPRLDVKFDLLLTDPPYGIKRFKNGIGNGDRMKNKANGGFNNNPPDVEWLNVLLNIAQFSIVWGMNNLSLPNSEHFLVWDKEQSVDNFASAELAWCNLPKPAKVFKLNINRHNQNKAGGHPTEKPLSLIKWCITQAPDSVKTILDPFAGSGTTGVAAKELNRKCVLIELEEKYCEIAARRLSQEVFNFEEVK